jgi:PAS domain S-box-containing protein
MNGKETTRLPEGKNRRLTAALLLAILIAGTLFVWWTVFQTDRRMRRSLLQQTQLVGQSISIEEHLKTLSGTAADLDNPHYVRLKEQLTAVRLADPLCRFVYLMGRKADGTIFFFVDSEPASSKDYSPPGQTYEEVSAGCRQVFDTKTAAVEGPVADRWGVWVTALDPMSDPKTGQLLAVLGLDIDARVWKWDVAARTALPAGLMLVLFIGVAATFFSTRHIDASPKPILRRLLPPLAAMVVLFAAGAGAFLWYQYQQRLNEDSIANTRDVSSDLRMALDQQSSGLAATLQTIIADSAMRTGLRQGDAESLLAVWGPVFETLREKHNLTHFCFFDKNRICLLRVQEPRMRGDRIDRFTALQAERTGKIASGIELGPLGTFTLRVVQPVFEGGTLIGYVELGKEIEDVLQTLHAGSGDQLAVIIGKEFLDRQSWEDGMRRLGRESDWNRLPRKIVSYVSQASLSDAFASWADQGSDQLPHDRKISFAGKDWRVSATPLQDVVGKEVGDLLIMRDISNEKASLVRLIALSGMSGVVLVTLLLGFIYVLLCRTDAGICAQQKALHESEERFRSYFELPLIGMAVTSSAKGWIHVNDRICSILGYTREELAHLTWSEITHPDDLAADVAQFDRLLSGAIKQYTLEKRFIRKDGTVVWTDLSVGCVRESKGSLKYLVTLMSDITERKEIEEGLEKARKEREQLIGELKAAMANVKSLSGLLPICATCKKVRDDRGYWSQVESYIQDHTEATFSHSMCPDCFKRLYPELAKARSGNSPKEAS